MSEGWHNYGLRWENPGLGNNFLTLKNEMQSLEKIELL